MAMSFYTKSSNTIDVRTFYCFLNLSEEGRVPMSGHTAECQTTTNVVDSIAKRKQSFGWHSELEP